jgi:riboflavin synthase
LALSKIKKILNIHINDSAITELQIDQGVAHNGISLDYCCNKWYFFVYSSCIDETVQKTNLGDWKIGDTVNLERAMKLGDEARRPHSSGTCRPDRNLHYHQNKLWKLALHL